MSNIKPILAPYVEMADMLVQTFGLDCEVVLHDLEVPEHSVVYVANSTVTGRKIGESFDQLIRQVILSDNLRENYVANYYFTAPNGKRIRSSTLLIKDDTGHLAGALCINLDTTKIMKQIAFLQSFLPEAALLPEAEDQSKEQESIEQDTHISVMIDSLISRIIGSVPVSALTREERIEKIRFMEAKGIFLMKGSVEKVAEKMGINKVTVYSYLNEIREN